MEHRSESISTESISTLLARDALFAATTGALGALLLAVEDVLRVHTTESAYLSQRVDRVVHIIATVGVFCVLGPLFGLAVGGWLRLATRIGRRSRYPSAALGALPFVVAVALLNRNILTISLLVYVFALFGVAVLSVGMVLFASVRYSWIAALAVTSAALHADATLYVRLYPGQHQTLALQATVGALWLALHAVRVWRPLTNARIRVALLGTCLVAASVLFGFGREQVSHNVRYLSYDVAPMQRHAVSLLSKLTDWDRDGEAALLGGGDCDNFDATVHPGALELPMNGIDDDCLGGDLTDAQSRRYMEIMRRPLPTPRAPAVARHLVFISVDAVRYDRTAHMPELNAIAKTGIRFDRMYVAHPTTTLGLFSIATSTLPSRIRLSPYYQFRFPIHDSHRTLAEVLKTAGFSVHGWMFHHMFQPKLGLTRGFDSAWAVGSGAEDVLAVAGGRTVDQALAALPDLVLSGDRLFLWIHLYDPHDPYQVHPEHDYGPSVVQRYNSEVAYSDDQIGRLVAGLGLHGIANDALIAIFADHGEEFGDHGGWFHGTTLYDEVVRVPLVVLMPGVKPHVVETPTSAMDLAPTMLDYLGLSDEIPASFRGSTLRGALENTGEPTRPVFMECIRPDGEVLRAVVFGPWKLIHRQSLGVFELYHLEHDPKERLNAYELFPDVAMELEVLLGAWTGTEQLGRPASAG